MFRSSGPVLLFLLLLNTPLFAQDTPEAASSPAPQFQLIGDISQTANATAPEWGKEPVSSWAFNTDLKPKFTYGHVVFMADTTWTLPMTASLTAANVQATIYEAYFRFSPVSSLDLTFGQKHYNIGVGQTITVGDSINPSTGFFDQKTGFRGATAEWSPNSSASASAAISTENSDLTAAGQISYLLGKLQLTGSLVADGTKARTFNPALGASYDLVGVILTAEGGVEFLPQRIVPSNPNSAVWKAPAPWSNPAVSGSFGARWTVTLWDLDYTISGQYLHWGQGWTKDETDNWKYSPQSYLTLTSLSPVRSQENAIFQFDVSSGSTWDLSGLTVVDLQDQSLIGRAAVAWDPWDNVEFGLALLMAEGSSGSTFQALPPDPLLNLNSAQSRYQVSFSTTYHF